MLSPCFVIRSVSFLVFNHFPEEKRTGGFTYTGILLSFGCLGPVSLSRSMVGWSEERLKNTSELAWPHCSYGAFG